MADNTIEVKVVADTGDLSGPIQAAVESVKGQVNSLRSQLRSLGADFEAGKTSSGNYAKELVDLGDRLADAKGRLGGLTSALGGATGAAGAGGSAFNNMGSELRHVVAIFDEFSRGARGQMIGSIVALTRDSGLLGKVVGSLKGPFGIAIAIAGALAGAFVLLAMRAAEAAKQIREVSAAAAMQGRDVGAAVASAQRWTESMAKTGMLSHSSAQTVADAISKIPNIADETRDKIAGIGEALTVAMGGDAKKAAAEIDKAFGSISGLAHFADQNNMMTASAVEAMAKEKGAAAAYDAVIAQAQARLSGYSAAAKKAKEDAAGINAGANVMGYMPVPSSMVFPLQFPQGARGPSPQEWQLTSDIQTGAHDYEEMNALARQQDEILTSIRSGEAERLGLLDRAKAALMEIEEKMDTLRKKGEGHAGTREDESKAFDFTRHVHVPKAPSTAGADRAVREDYQAFAAEERDKLSAAQGNADAQNAILDAWRAKAAQSFAAGSAAYRKAMAEIERASQSIGRANFAQVMKDAESAIAGAHDQLREFRADMDAMAKLKQITPQQALGFDIEEVARAAAEARAKIQSAIDAAATPQHRADAQRLMNRTALRFNAEQAVDTDQYREAGAKAAEAFSKPFRETFDRLGSTLESTLTEYLIHGTSKGYGRKEVASLIQSAIGGGVDLVGGALSKVSAGPLAKLLGTQAKEGEGAGDVLGNALSGWVSKGLTSMFPSLGGMLGQGTQAAAQTANTAAVTALTVALTANTAAVTGAAATTGVAGAGLAAGAAGAAGAAAGGGGLFGWLGGLFAFKGGGVVPSASGGWALPNFAGAQPALLHAREMVLPEHISTGLQDMLGRGGGRGDTHLHVHGQIVDAPAVGRWFRDNKRLVASAVQGSFGPGGINPFR
ncbi:MAG TPA: hypothetical protein VHW66_18970 [Stellaceae bacterium]|jgi:hypothetical protein|nr:hypothetical protein [Stellaceae bacterium]